MNLNCFLGLATLFLVCLWECKSQSTARCIEVDDVIRLSSSAVEVDWTIIFALELGEQYVVAYGFSEDSLNQSSMPVNINDTSGGILEMYTYRLFIDGLDPMAKYYFQVQVVGFDPPDCSEIQCINAPTGMLPTEVPTRFTAVPTGPRQVQFSWSTAADSLVHFSCHTIENIIVNRSILNSSELTVTDFTEAYTVYICDISVHVSVGVVGPSSTVVFRTLQDVPGTPPTNVQIALVSQRKGKVRVTWSPPTTPNGIIIQYRLSATLNGSPFSIITVPGEDLTDDIDGLPPFGIVNVTVSASTMAGEGRSSPTVTLRTPEALPNAPDITNVKRCSSDSMQVNWTAANPGGLITRYTVEYEPLYTVSNCQRLSVDVNLSEAVSQDSNMKTINGLQSGYSYTVSVIAYNSIGMSPRSAPASVTPFISGDTGYSDDTRSSVVQLRLSGVENCSTWIEENTSVELMSEIAVRLSIICPTCGYTSVKWLMNSILQCTGRDDQVLFRAILSTAVCSGPTLSCSKHLEYWASLQDPFLIFGEQILLVDSTCPLYTNSLTSDDCMESMTMEGTDPICTPTNSQGGAIAGSFLGGALAGCAFSLILIVAIYAYFLRKHNRAKSSENVDSNNPITWRPKALSEEADPGYEPLPLHADWMGSKLPKDPGTENQTTSHYEDDDNAYEIPCIPDSSLQFGSLPNSKRSKSRKKLGSMDTGSKAESEKVAKLVRSASVAQKEQRVQEASNPSEQRTPGKKMLLFPPGQGGSTGSKAESEKAPQHVKVLRSSSTVQKEQRVQEASNPTEQRTPGKNTLLLSPGQGVSTASEAESEKAPSKHVKELRSTSTVQKEQRVREASNPTEQRTPGKKVPLRPPGQGKKPHPMSKPKRVQDEDKARGSPPAIQPKPKNKATGNITLQPNAAYEKLTQMGSAASH